MKAETDQRFKENEQRFKENEQRFKETKQLFEETDRQIQATSLKVQEVSAQIGRLGGRLGEFVEGFVAPACTTLFAQRGIPIHKVSRRVEVKRPGGRHMEIDLLVVNTDTVALVEVKSKLVQDDVREHLIRLGEFKEFFPEYADKRAIGAVAGMVVEENVIHFAIKSGLFVIVQSGESLHFANSEEFVPRAW
ncbi:MAG: DUF3782 domain-containing protein [Magnetococcales bacterium]|nr:DUF3782 domain-containing protein [Magnetococcales bacterium]MBF0150910.1 DUF3782 domain-containing protein [Magnetococcales bacterium]MBF0173880.1 DUF3782 domain-containing protein [Magnetococcales bacterium]MBF0631448.1 DUF3782 domain-containing protein [Magnetococcales bacterium]